MHVIDGEEVQRGWHLGIQDIKHHRFEHQDEGDEHLVAAGFIEAESFAEEENRHHDGQHDQHQVGDFNVMHQPGAEENHHHGADQHVQQITETQRLMIRG